MNKRAKKLLSKYHRSLEYQLSEILSQHAGERGHTEGAVDTLCRIIFERNRAMTLLALDRINRD